ncbi:MAG: hypothetical protein AAF743_05885 [Planctomycetota bacterium]
MSWVRAIVIGLCSGSAAVVGLRCSESTPSTWPAVVEVGQPVPAATPRVTLRPPELDDALPELRFDEAPLEEVVSAWADATGLTVDVNFAALELTGIDRTTPITADLTGGEAAAALDGILREAGGGFVRLGFAWRGGRILISTDDDLGADVYRQTRVYDVRDLVLTAQQAAQALFDTMPKNEVNRPRYNYDASADTERKLREMLVPIIGSDVHRRDPHVFLWAGRLAVRATPEQHDKVVELLRTLRERPEPR